MASIKPRTNQKGEIISYTITVSCGRSQSGKKVCKYKQFIIPEKMTPKQAEKEVNRLAVLFQEEVKSGNYLKASKITFGEFALGQWWNDYAVQELTPGTLKPYKHKLETRIIPAIGEIKLDKLQTHHIVKFINNLKEDNLRLDGKLTPTPALVKLLEPYPTQELVKLSGISTKTILRLKQSEPTKYDIADKLCTALKKDVKKMFTAENGGKLSDKSIKNHLSIISSILTTAVEWELIPSNCAENATPKKRNSKKSKKNSAKPKAKYYDDEQLKAMFTTLENEPLHYKAMLYFVVDTGLRSGEVTGITWDSIDLTAGEIAITQQRQYVSGYGTFTDDPKTDNAIRVVTLSPTVIDLLTEYKEQQEQDKAALGDYWKNTDGFVFVHEDGEPLHPQRPSKWFAEFLERHGLPKIKFHEIRHTNASLMIMAGVDIVTVSARLGHSDSRVTLDVYSHVIKSKEKQAANKMERFYNRTTPKESPIKIAKTG